MTADERDLTPEEEAEISRLVADAGGPVPTPPEVVARLDDVLAGLVAERAADPGAATAATGRTPLPADAERRRRRWPKALLAAAAVVAGGYGVGAALTGTTMSGDAESADSAVSADESAAGGSTSSGSDAGGDGDGQGMGSEPQRDATDGRLAQAPANASALRQQPPRVRSDHLTEDVVRVLDSARELPGDSSGDSATVPERTLLGAAAACLPPRLGRDDTWFLVRYDGRRAALLTSPLEGGAVRASVLGCDGERLDTVTVPAR